MPNPCISYPSVGWLSSRDPIPVYRRKDTSLLVWNPEQTPVILNQPEG